MVNKTIKISKIRGGPWVPLTIPFISAGLPPVNFSKKKLEKIKKNLIEKLKVIDQSIEVIETEQLSSRDFFAGNTYNLAEINSNQIKGNIRYTPADERGISFPGKVYVELEVNEDIYTQTKKAVRQELRPLTSFIWS